MVTKNELLTHDMIVAIEIHKLKKEDVIVNLAAIVKSLRETINENTIIECLNTLQDIHIVDVEWKKVDGKWCRLFDVTGEATNFIHNLSNNIGEK